MLHDKRECSKKKQIDYENKSGFRECDLFICLSFDFSLAVRVEGRNEMIKDEKFSFAFHGLHFLPFLTFTFNQEFRMNGMIPK